MRTINWFSCGAASAVATMLSLKDDPGGIVAYTEIVEEHPDNKRFLKGCEELFGKSVDILRNEKYNASIYEVFERVQYLKGPNGAACTRLLKKGVREAFQQPGDVHVFGYTSDEEHRLDRMLDTQPTLKIKTPLIDRGLTKGDCLGILKEAGIELPMMYRLGYRNNNCIGCVKGESGYWNKIRVDFPAVFERMSQVEKMLGRTVCKIERGGDLIRLPLAELPPDAGHYPSETAVECGIFCHMVDMEINPWKEAAAVKG